jgi:Spy/CpxP family protein refolding chaperone
MCPWKVLNLSLMIALCWAVTGWSAPAGMMQGPGGRAGLPYFGRLLHALQLTDAQQTQIHDIVAAHRPLLKTLHAQVRATQQQLTDLLLSPATIDATALQAETQQLEQQRAQVLAEQLALAQDIRGVLTTDQLTQATQLKRQLRDLNTTRQQLLAPQP